ncbi:MAG: ATP-binding cassette domain-containing protein, partial [Ruminococcus sp.]|nr:ATP-binding cassette domain-containing protein [Ruminococcus sp.]
MSDIILKTHDLTKDYGRNRGIFNINLEVKKGEVFGFIGTNGSGKTTTIRNLMGFIQPDKGTTSVCGLDSWKNSAEIMESVSYVPGEISFPSLATGTEFLKS